MDFMKLANELLSDDKKKLVFDLLIEEISKEIQPMGWSLIRTEEFNLLKKTKVLPAKEAKNHKKQVTIHGETFPSVSAAARYYNIAPSKLYNWINKGFVIDDMLVKKEDLKLTAQTTDENGFVTKIRRADEPVH